MPLSEQDFADEADNILFRSVKLKKWDKVAELLSSSSSSSSLPLVKELDTHDNTILHAAIGYHAPDELLFTLIKLHPEATRIHGANEWLPLHLAVMWGSSRAVLEQLIRAHPDGLDDRGEGGIKGRTPRHFKDRFPQNRDLLERSTDEWKELIQRNE